MPVHRGLSTEQAFLPLNLNMSLLPELAAALAGVPMPPAPPEGVPIHLATREKMKVMLSAYKAYYASRLPPGTPSDREYLRSGMSY